MGTTLRWLAVLAVLAGCAEAPETLFRSVPAKESGIDFRNDLTEGPGANIIDYLYFYDGGGVGILDMDGDGLMDVFLTANQQPNRLYRNLGGMRFEDVTETAGVAGSGDWTKGVLVVDVNADGRHDLYVTNVHHAPFEGRNELFVNDGDGTFTEAAEQYGLAFQGLATHAAFLDVDQDLDLDAFLVNHSTHDTGVVGGAFLREETSDVAGDRLYRNDDGVFVNATEGSGIISSFVGYGLSAGASDLDRDGCADLYVANDFHENDYLYLGDCEGGFQESITTAVGHTSRSSMGQDIADLDGDGWPDIIVTDMLPQDAARRVTSATAESYEIYHTKLNAGYHAQVARNTLLWNRGSVRFSEVGLFAGIEASDWSWAVLAADLDNDGLRDLVMTNGIPRRPNDLDYLDWVRTPRGQRLASTGYDSLRVALDRMPQAPSPNRSFRNAGGLKFEPAAWGLEGPGVSNGAAYADLDNDGDLDVIINNLGDAVSVLENTSDSGGLMVVLEGETPNRMAIGAEVVAWSGGVPQYTQVYPGRGWASSVDPRVHVAPVPDSLQVRWPGGRVSSVRGPVGPVLTVSEAGSLAEQSDAASALQASRLVKIDLFGDLSHEENAFFDYSREPFIPHLVSEEGPALAVGDVNGDGLDDVFLGSSKWRASVLAVQGEEPLAWTADSLHEDVDAAFLDADGDGDLDLLVVSGGNEFWGSSEALRDRLYRNDGSGGFVRDDSALPERFVQSCCLAVTDVDADGDLDVFVGARSTSRDYSTVPESALLINDGAGVFEDRTPDSLRRAGRLTAAVWLDANGDDWPDLAVAGDFMPVMLYAGGQAGLQEPVPLTQNGYWRSLHVADWDADGHDDLLAGNLGVNSMLARSESAPALRFGDFDGNGSREPLLTWTFEGRERAFPSLDVIRRALPQVGVRYGSYSDYAGEDLSGLLGRSESTVVPIETLESVVLMSDGEGGFRPATLPVEANLSPMQAAVTLPGNGVITAGNWTGAPPDRGPYTAGWGLLHGADGSAAPLHLSGLVRSMALARGPDGAVLVVARNDGPLSTYSLR
ncbi:MAG: VCBS repeat-containing protein [Rhodothermales bacterium]|nr:VCBS repeat-containing protein [Rhodothermales bacterium]MBO6781112.1 VCBS repeat-containing protein [Rhodothermales bacterium]